MRRSLIAVTAVGGTLALAASASAIPVPIGNSSDAPYSGSGTPASVYSLLNASYAGLSQADQALVGLGDAAVPSPMPPETSPTGTPAPLTTAQAERIAADFTGQTINKTAPSSAVYSAELTVGDPSYSTQAPAVGSAGTSWDQLSQLVSFLSPAAGVMNSADSATVSSSGTVTSTTAPAAYDVKLSAPSGGYIVPGAFAMTFPAGLAVNAALVGAEVNAATNTAAVELNPTGTSIGTVTLTSPLADEFGGSNNQLVGKIYVVQTGQASGQGSVTQPYLELWFPGLPGYPIYALGSFPSSLAFPLTLNFGEAYVSLLGQQEPLPLNSLELSFPAATSPVKSNSCTTMGTAGGEVTDSIANLAYEFGDATDGVTSLTGTPSAVALAATPTAVTNTCAAATGSASSLTSGSPALTLKVKTPTAFKAVTIGLPGGLKFVKSKSLAAEVSAAKVKSVKIAGGKLVISLKSSVKSLTIKTKKGLISESTGLIKSIKKHKTKKLTFTVNAGSASIKASIKA
jgi:hypothetical protein